MKYKYKGNEDKIYIDETGKSHYLTPNTIVELKTKPNWDTIVEREKTKNDYLKKLESEEKQNVSSKRRKL